MGLENYSSVEHYCYKTDDGQLILTEGQQRYDFGKNTVWYSTVWRKQPENRRFNEIIPNF